MKNIQLLDTTLRDGMNVTDFHTDDAIKRDIITGLVSSGVDIVECGFLRTGEQKVNSAIYSAVGNISPFIQPKRKGIMYAAICSLFDGAAPDITPRDNTTIDIIRIAAFKHGMREALILGENYKNKGYEVMLQPSRTSDYSDTEMLQLIRTVNEMELYSFAIVDSFGNMLPKDILKLARMYEEHLDNSVRICYHFHNNMQLAFANAIAVLENTNSEREIVLDASIFGMGCGAGNLPIELIMNYLNTHFEKNYDVSRVFELYEKYFLNTFKQSHWGYQPRNFITAKYNVHPYYGVYLETKYSFDAKMLDAVFSQMNEDDKVNFIRRIADEIGFQQ